MNLRRFTPACLLIVSIAGAQTLGKTDPSTEVGIFAGQGKQILGSELKRDAYGFSLAHGKPEPHFRIGKLPAQLVYEGYVLGTHSQANSFHAAQDDLGLGGLMYARYRWARNHGIGAYFDAGIGLIYVDKTNRDLSSHINSTPYLASGITFPSGKGEFILGGEWLHISNAGTVGHNLGANLFLVSLKYRW
jgi:hypothetical protein